MSLFSIQVKVYIHKYICKLLSMHPGWQTQFLSSRLEALLPIWVRLFRAWRWHLSQMYDDASHNLWIFIVRRLMADTTGRDGENDHLEKVHALGN